MSPWCREWSKSPIAAAAVSSPDLVLQGRVPVRGERVQVAVGIADIDGTVHDDGRGGDGTASVELPGLEPIGSDGLDLTVGTGDEDARR